MKITTVETITLQHKTGNRYHDAIHTFGDPATLVVKVHTDEGIVGWATSHFGTAQRGVDVLRVTLEKELAPVIQGMDPFFTKQVREKLWAATEYHGANGISHWAMSAIDICLWDIVGKALGQPVFKLLGAQRDRIPAYAMVGWYYDDLERFKDMCRAVVAEGFRALKIKVGRYDLNDDVRRIEAVKEAVGPDVRIMVDGNQAFSEAEALRRGKVYEELDVFWFEEPLRPHQKTALARIASELTLRIATGENDYGKHAFLDLLRMGAADVLQPDNRRSGGVTEWMEIGALAAAFDIPVASHGGGSTNVHLLCAMPTAIYLEAGSLKNDRAHITPLRMENGEVLCPTEPGLGNELRDDYIERFRVDDVA